MPIAGPPSSGAIHAVIQKELAEMGHERFGLGEVYELSLTRAGSMQKRRAYGEDGRDAPNGVRMMHQGIRGQVEAGITP